MCTYDSITAAKIGSTISFKFDYVNAKNDYTWILPKGHCAYLLDCVAAWVRLESDIGLEIIAA